MRHINKITRVKCNLRMATLSQRPVSLGDITSCNWTNKLYNYVNHNTTTSE